ncbi:hypothetical protein K1719_001842 [Acacia pycnantha]|nr:hypothetical protein K1719_001842 [Acacia pycnantha]
MERASEIKTPHSKATKKKIDLPVQKNVLTKYFCFASLEAKRKFIAPRMSPSATDQSTPGSSSVISQDHETLETAAAKTNSSASSLVDYKILSNVPPVNNRDESGLSAKFSELLESSRFSKDMAGERRKNPEHTILQKPIEPIHKPCLGLYKEHKDSNVKDTSEGKTTEATRKENSKIQLRERLRRQQERSLNTISDITLSKVEDNRKTPQATRKILVRSPFFQHEPVEKNNCDQQQDCLVKDDIAIGEPKNTISENHRMNKLLKRKISPADSAQRENLHPGNMHSASTLPDNGVSDQNSDRTFKEGNSEEKFGANISHLGHYSKISEESLEKFTSMLSSFRYTSSGSRASGLRAPLKDVQNTGNTRPKPVDFEHHGSDLCQLFFPLETDFLMATCFP